MTKYDAIIIGAGQAGRPLAQELAKRGWNVALAEGDRLGGTCVNTGCTPSKTLIASARAAHVARRSADFGIRTGTVRVDFEAVMDRVHRVVEGFRSSSEAALTALESLTIYHDYASFESATRVRIGDKVIESDHIYINTGARPARPDIPGLDADEPLDTESILNLRTLPKRLVILGGGYVGLEYAQAFRRLGSAVTLIDRGEQLLENEDADVAEEMRKILEGEGVRVLLNAEATLINKTPKGITVALKGGNAPKTVHGTHVLTALGRVPNTEKLNLEAAGVKVDEDGYIVVNDQMQTNVSSIWALGDVNGRGAFTHTSWDDHLIALEALDGKKKTVSQRHPIYAVYTDPPLGRVGITEREARESGQPVSMAVMPMSSVGRAIERDETQGLMKVLVNSETKRFLGAAILGIGGDEVIHTIADLIYADAPFTVMKDAVHIHPTVSELLPTLLGKLAPLQ